MPPSPPATLRTELVRERLVDRLTGRFARPITIVAAAAGFGKSTLLAQATRANDLAPLGVDVLVAVQPGDEYVDQLVYRVLSGVPSPEPGPADPSGHRPVLSAAARRGHKLVTEAIEQLSPLDVCIIVDDCHRLPEQSSGERMLIELARNLPANGHLVLSGRRVPQVPVARLRAQGDLDELNESDLAFSDEEIHALADVSGTDVDDVERVGGWPALVRLMLTSRKGARREFLAEEVIGDLAGDDRRTLAALSVVGPADDQLIGRLVHDAVPLADLAERVPLVSTMADGRMVAHDLWADAVDAVIDQAELRGLRGAACDDLLASGQIARAGSVAIAAGDLPRLGACARMLVAEHLTNLPVDTAVAWLNAVPNAQDVGGLSLLDAACRMTTDLRDRTADAILDRVMAMALDAGDLHLEATTIGVAAIIAHGTNDFERLVPLARRASELRDQIDDPVLDLIANAMIAIGADLRGDPEGVLVTLRDVQYARIPPGVALTVQRLHLQALWMTGRARESVDFAVQMAHRVPSDITAAMCALARWFAGEPDEFARTVIATNSLPPNSDRDRFVTTCFATMMAASLGLAEIDEPWEDGSTEALAFDDSRDRAHLTNARAARAISHHDEAGAQRLFSAHLARCDVADVLSERHLRRWPALGYVLSERLRDVWDATTLGPAHESACRSARALLAARSGIAPSASTPGPDEILTHLPLTWSLELAAREEALGDARGRAYVDRVADLTAGPVRRVLAALAEHEDPSVREGARSLRRRLPTPPDDLLEIRVLGPLEIRRNGRAVDAPELRRRRVRQLLAAVILERTVRRERVAALLWPELGEGAASANLRVNLTHLRRLLEPDRHPGEPGFHLRVDQSTIRLHESDHLVVDVWQHIDDLDGRRFDRLAARWRGEPFADLLDVDDVQPSIEGLRSRHVTGLLSLGELAIARGSAALAADCAVQALRIDPLREQSHRLAIAAAMQQHSPADVALGLRQLDAALRELGVGASEATDVLRRRVAQQFGSLRAAHHSGGSTMTSR